MGAWNLHGRDAVESRGLIRNRFAVWLVSLLVGVLFFGYGVESEAQSRKQKTLIMVLPFSTTGGTINARTRRVRRGVIKALRPRAEIVPIALILRSRSDKASPMSSEFVLETARGLGVDAIVAGEVADEVDERRLRLAVYAVSGDKEPATLSIKLSRSGRVSSRNRRRIRVELRPFLRALNAPSGSSADDAWKLALDSLRDEGDSPGLPPGLGDDSSSSDDPGSDTNGGSEPDLPPGINGGGSDSEPDLPPGINGGGSDSEPDLPPGINGGSDEPDLPSGLGGSGDESGPALPAGLGDIAASDEDNDDDEEASEDLLESLNLTGFADIRGGVRVVDDANEDQATMSEARLQLQAEREIAESATVEVAADVIVDTLDTADMAMQQNNDDSVEVLLRKASLSLTPLEFLDLKVGRQILTWGTGDFVFLNDLFPKDFIAQFIGRSNDYLKAPTDALKASIFTSAFNLDFVLVPEFTPDQFIVGERLSFFDPLSGQQVGQENPVQFVSPDDVELHGRLSRKFGALEFALYGYYGFWKSPGGIDMDTMAPTFPELAVYGGSIQDQVASGIANFEIAYYDSIDDQFGTDPLVNNGELRLLIGYERQYPSIAEELTINAQYYFEIMSQYDEYLASLPPGFIPRDRVRHLGTMRIIKQAMQQRLVLQLLLVYSPSDGDAYVRPSFDYKASDCCTLSGGGNLFIGTDEHTQFSQLRFNSNVFAAVRYSF